jgi:hypothetical protein
MLLATHFGYKQFQALIVQEIFTALALQMAEQITEQLYLKFLMMHHNFIMHVNSTHQWLVL